VAHWGACLAALGNETGIEGASVTVETAPDSGLRLRRNVEDNVADNAPEFGLAVLAEIVDSYPAGAAQIQTRITLTFSGAASEGIKARGTAEMATEIGNRLPMLLGSLRATGAGSTPRACSAADIVDATRVAYDPSVAMRVEQARAEGGTGLTWDEAGPVYAQAEYDYYRRAAPGASAAAPGPVGRRGCGGFPPRRRPPGHCASGRAGSASGGRT